MKFLPVKIAVGLAVFLSVQPVVAQNQPKGHIFNIDGEKCTFTQTTVSETYLHSIKANTGSLVFDDPTCMEAGDLGLTVNQMMIANFIVKRYGQPDAAFQTRTKEFKRSSALQVRGICIQSATYPMVGVVAEFQVSGGYISGVKHAMAAGGCSN